MPCVHSATAGGPAPIHHLRSPRPPRGSARSTATWRRGWTASAVSPTGLRPTAPPRRSTIWRNSPPSWRRGSSPTSGGTTSWPQPGSPTSSAARTPLGAMRSTHLEITHLTRRYRRLVDSLPPSGPTAEDVLDLRRTLYGLDAILRLHNAQEDELYDWLWSAAPARRPTRNLLTTEVSPLRGGSLAGRGRGVE